MTPLYIKDYLEKRLLDPNDFTWDYYYDKYWIGIPVYDADGMLLFKKLRKDPFDETHNTKYKFYPSKSHATLFGQETISPTTKEIFICEGEFDSLVLRNNGLIAVSSTNGTATFMDEWIDKFKHVPNIYICFDSDQPGFNGATKLLTKLLPLNNKLFFITLPVKDITDYFVAGGTVKELKDLAVEILIKNLPVIDIEDVIDPELAKIEMNKLANLLEDVTRKNVLLNNINAALIEGWTEDIKKKIVKLRRRINVGKYNNNADLETLKAIPISVILDAYNIKYNKAGNQTYKFKIRNENTASAVWYQETNSWYDHGNSEGGSIIDLIIILEKCDLKDAIDKLKYYA